MNANFEFPISNCALDSDNCLDSISFRKLSYWQVRTWRQRKGQGAIKGRRSRVRVPSGLPGTGALSAFREPDNWKSSWQIVNTLIPYLFFWYLLMRSIQLGRPFAITVILTLLASAFLVRIFILFHDCVHGSLFRMKGLNTFFGYLFGILVFTPFEDWRFSHLRHHVSYANLDARGYGDIWTLTRAEFEKSSKGQQLIYRFCRHPAVVIGLGAVFAFCSATGSRPGKRSARNT